MNVRLFDFSKQKRIKVKGAIFCHLRIRADLNQLKPSTTCGTQRWKGAAPSLIKSLLKMKLENKLKEETEPNNILLLNALQIRTAEASAWIRKYFKVASEFRDDLNLISRANSPSILISRPIHAIIQEEAERAIIVPKKIIYKNMIFHGRKRIKRGSTSIFGI